MAIASKQKLDGFEFDLWFERVIACDDHRTLGMLLYLVGQIVQDLLGGQSDEALCDALLLVASLEQCILDSGKWHTAYPLTLAPDVPWSHVMRKPTKLGGSAVERQFSRSVPESWIQAITKHRKGTHAMDLANREAVTTGDAAAGSKTPAVKPKAPKAKAKSS